MVLPEFRNQRMRLVRKGIKICHPGKNDAIVSFSKMRPTLYKEGAGGPIGTDPLQSAP